MTILKLLFGNLINVKNSIDALAASNSVKEFYEVFYKAFFESIEDFKDKTNNEKNIQIIEVDRVLRLPDCRDAFMQFFKTEIDDVSSFREFINDDKAIEQFAEILIQIISKYEAHLDFDTASIIVKQALEFFRLNIYNALSPKQSLGLILSQEFQNVELIEEIKNKLKYHEYQNQTILGNQETILGAIEGVGQIMGQRLNNIEISLNQKEKDWEKKYMEELLFPIFENDLNESKKLYKEKFPSKALVLLDKLSTQEKYNETSKEFRAIIESFKGHCNNALGDHSKASNHYHKAAELNSGEIDYLYNSANAYELTGSVVKVAEIASKILTSNPVSPQGIALKIRSSDLDTPLKEVVASISDEILNSIEVLLSLSTIAFKRKNRTKQIHFLREALKRKSDNIEIKLLLANSLARKYSSTYSPSLNQPLTDKAKVELREAREIYLSVWQELKNTELANKHITIALNASAISSRLREKENAIRIIEDELSDYKNSPLVQLNKVLFLCDLGRYDEALDLSLNNKDNGSPELRLISAELLLRVNKRTEAIECLQGFLTSHPQSERYSYGRFLLISILIDQKEIERAEELLNDSQGETLNDFKRLFLVARIEEIRKGDLAYIDKLNEASELIGLNSSIEDRVLLASAYFESKKWYKAIDLYTGLVKDVEPNPLLSNLIISYLNITEWEKGLTICQEIRAKFGFVPLIAEKELFALQKLKMFVDAIQVCLEFIKLLPSDIYFQIQLAQLYLDTNDIENSKKTLRSIDETKVSQTYLEAMTSIWLKIGEIDTILEIAYSYRRKNESFFAHNHYWKVILNCSNKIDRYFKSPNEVKNNCAVEVLLDNGVSENYIIEGDGVGELENNELNSENSLYQNIIGKNIGDKFLWEKTILGDKMATIKDIKTKWQHAYDETTKLLETRYKDKKAFQSFSTDTFSVDSIVDIQIKQQKSLDEFFENLHPVYRQGFFPISGISSYLNMSPLELIERLISEEKFGIKCSNGEEGSVDKSVKLISNEKKGRIAADIFALYTLFNLNLSQEILSSIGKVRITRSILDDIDQMYNRLNFGADTSSFSIVEREGERYKIEHTVEQKKSRIKYYKNFIDWIDTYCLVTPIVPEQSEKLDSFSKLICRSSIDSYLLAKQHNCLLLTDDYSFRKVLENDYNLKCIWSQSILLYLAKQNKINANIYHDKLIDLIDLNYHFISFDFLTLYAAAKKSIASFAKVAKLLSAPVCTDKSALMCGTSFLAYLWVNGDMSDQYKKTLTGLLFFNLSFNRNSAFIFMLLTEAIKKADILPDLKHKIVKALVDWTSVQPLERDMAKKNNFNFD